MLTMILKLNSVLPHIQSHDLTNRHYVCCLLDIPLISLKKKNLQLPALKLTFCEQCKFTCYFCNCSPDVGPTHSIPKTINAFMFFTFTIEPVLHFSPSRPETGSIDLIAKLLISVLFNYYLFLF